MGKLYEKLKNNYQKWVAKTLKDLTIEDEKDDERFGVGWDKLGYHRPIASYLYTFGLLIPSGILGMLLLPLLKYTTYRYPEITSFEVAAGALFGALYTILDLELKPAVDRFLPQYAVSDPKRAMQYVTFFVKYQMWSGLIQILFVAVFMFLYIIPYTSFAYLTWFILFINIKQYPAILSTFQSVIGSLQHGNKEQLIVFYRASVLEPLTKIGGGLLGLYWGAQNPVFGEMYGLALGWAIGSYVDDFFTFGLGMLWLSKILDKYGIRMWEIYGQKVPSPVWKSALNYSFRLLPKTIFSAIMGFFGFLVTYEGLPGYMTYQGILREAQNLKKFVGWSDDIINKSQPAYSEAFNNGMNDLTRYYIGEGLKYNSFFFVILGSFNVFALPVILEIALGVWLPESWQLIGVMVPWLIFTQSIHAPYDDVYKKMSYISGHPEINAVIDIIGTIVNLFFTYYFLMVLEIGWLGMILAPFPWSIASFIIRATYVQKKVLPLKKDFWKDYGWSLFVAPIGGGFAYVVYMEIILRGLWPIISKGVEGNALLIPAGFLLLMLLLGVMLIYIPLTSYLGFWDDRSLDTFRRATALSGPSLWLIYPMYKLFKKFHQLSPFKKQGYIKLGDKAMEELQALSELRAQKMVKYLKDNNLEENA